MEYHGDDLSADFERMNAQPAIKEWYTHCGSCQEPPETRAEGEWWARTRSSTPSDTT